ncbi:MAG: FAD-binding protein [Synergistaceae bacterium]|nr:FAD-binding protein [Synergistaceae bacterium]
MHEADVVIIGAGESGLTAAIAASDSGASVIVIE